MRKWLSQSLWHRGNWGNCDEFEDVRIAIVEGRSSSQMSGYALRISAACDSCPGQVQWMYPLPDSPNMLAKFELDYPQHGEFLLAPVVERDDDQLWFNI